MELFLSYELNCVPGSPLVDNVQLSAHASVYIRMNPIQ